MTAPFGFGNFVGGSGPQGRARALPSKKSATALAKLYGYGALNAGPSLGGLASAVRSAPAGYAKGGLGGALEMAGRAYETSPGVKETEDPMEAARAEAIAAGVPEWATYGVDILTPGPGELVAAVKAVKAAMVAGKIGAEGLAAVAPVVRKKLLRREVDPHRYSATAMPSLGGERYLKDIQVDVLPTAPEMPRKVFNVDELEGTTVTPIVGDRSARGGKVASIDGTPLNTPVPLDGGPDFMLGEASQSADEAIWASAQPIISRIQNTANRIADTTGDEVLGVYTAMSPSGVDFATFTSRAVAEQMPFAKVTKKAMKAVDREMKKVDPSWPGVGSPQLPGYLESGAEANTRVAFLQLLDMAPQKAAGFPDVGKARWAVTDPDLREAKTGSAGFAIGGLIPGREVITNPLHPHPTYTGAQLAGTYRGGLEEPVPWQIMFPDAAARYDPLKTKAGLPLNEAQKFYKFGKDLPSQRMGAKEVDSIGEWISRTSGSPR